MARNKEALLLLIDVGPSMHNVLPEVEKICSMLVQKKLIFGKYDEVGVVLFGTEDTDNELTSEIGGYEHVVVLNHLKVVDGDLIKVLEELPRGTVNGDFLDAIVVGMDMLIKKFGQTKGKKRLCLITNAIHPIKDPYEGTKQDQVITIAAQMAAHGMKMECIVYREEQEMDGNKSAIEDNDLLLDTISKMTSSRKVHVENSTSLLGALRTRNISPVTIYRGGLELSSEVKVMVWVYKKTSEEKFPTLKKYSDKAPETDKLASHEVKVEYEYKKVDDPSKVVPPEQRIKGYRYGPQVVPISSAEWEAVKFKPEKGAKLLGFTDASNIMRHYYMKDVNIVIAQPGNTKAALAVSALARAMKEMNKVAIVRCVWRQGQTHVVIGVLTPNISDRDDVPDSFYLNVLPFAEDVREFQFPSFSNFPSSLLPNNEQQEAADNLVKMLDLAPTGKGECLQPEFTPNPVLEVIRRKNRLIVTMGEFNLLEHNTFKRFYRYLELKSRHLDAAVPPLDETLKKITEPDSDLLSHSKPVIDEFRRLFELKENPKLKKSSRRLLRDKPSGSNEEREDPGNIDDAEAINSIEPASAFKVEKIGDSNPVQDFESMMLRRDGTEWVNKAIADMKSIILQLITDSYEGDNFQKVLDCLIALRKGCILEQEPKQFNDFLLELCKFCTEKDLASFTEFLASKNLMLISKTEAEESEITEDEAKSFLVKAEQK